MLKQFSTGATFIGALLCFSYNVLAQSSNRVEEYYKYVNTANIDISKSAYEEALDGFKEAFKFMQSPHFMDLNNALFSVVQSKKNEPDFTASILKKIQKKGICVHERYQDIEGYASLVKSIPHQDCNKVADSVTARILNRAMKLDQVLREFGRVEYGSVYHPDVFGGIRIIDSLNMHYVDSLLKEVLQENIHLEDYVGVQNIHHVYVILLHNGPWGRVDRDLLTQLVQQGLLDGRLFAFLFDELCNGNYRGEIFSSWNEDNDCNPSLGIFGTTKALKCGDTFYIGIDTISNLYRKVEANRRTFFLPEIHDDAQVAAYSYYMRDKGMYYGMIRDVGCEMAESSMHYFKSNGLAYYKISSLSDLDF